MRIPALWCGLFLALTLADEEIWFLDDEALLLDSGDSAGAPASTETQHFDYEKTGDEKQHFDYFKTEPTFRASKISITVNEDASLLEPGYIFLTPFDATEREGYGPQIYDVYGNLVWYGNATAQHRAMHMHVCDYRGARGQHLCFHDSKPEFSPYARGNITVLDDSYRLAGPLYGAAGGLEAPDLHELSFIDRGRSLLHTVYEVKRVDMTPYSGPWDGYVLDGCFQERSVADQSITFQWCAMDHVELWETSVFNLQSANNTTPVAGNGSQENPWDYFHINSVEKDPSGDYLISSRHFNALFKIAGQKTASPDTPPGSILWQLGGYNNDFRIDGFNFSRQHMARVVSSAPNGTLTVSIFDNAFDAFLASNSYSRGQLIGIDPVRWRSWLIREYPSPDGLLSHSQGGVQMMPRTGNLFVDWGFYPFYSEFSLDGTLLYHASFAVSGVNIQSYRAYKTPWVGKPKSRPKALGYSSGCSGSHPTYVYMSWNGATEVARWRIYASSLTRFGPWMPVSTVDKGGFETVAELSGSFGPWLYAEAIDSSGAVLGSTKTVKIFVPSADMKDRCNERECLIPEFFDYDKAWGQASKCRARGNHGTVLSLLAWAAVVSTLAYVVTRWTRGTLRRGNFDDAALHFLASMRDQEHGS